MNLSENPWVSWDHHHFSYKIAWTPSSDCQRRAIACIQFSNVNGRTSESIQHNTTWVFMINWLTIRSTPSNRQRISASPAAASTPASRVNPAAAAAAPATRRAPPAPAAPGPCGAGSRQLPGPGLGKWRWMGNLHVGSIQRSKGFRFAIALIPKKDWDLECGSSEMSNGYSIHCDSWQRNKLWHQLFPRNLQRSEPNLGSRTHHQGSPCTSRHMRSRRSAGHSSAAEQRAARGRWPAPCPRW